MENASEALKMAGAMLLFVGALSVAIFVLSKARLASASIMEKKDAKRSFYTIENVDNERVVGIDTVIANMYNYYQTQSTIVFYKADNSGVNIQPMPMYYTEASDVINPSKGLTVSTLDKAVLSIYNMYNQDKTDYQIRDRETKEKRSIFGIDIHDELTRQEPWTRNEETAKHFIDAMVNRVSSPGYDVSLYSGLNSTSKLDVPSNRGYFSGIGNYFDYIGTHHDDTINKDINDFQLRMDFVYTFKDNKPLINMENAKFIERIGVYNYESFYNSEYKEDDIMGNHLVTTYEGSEIDPSRIAFNETNETIENNKGEKKTVIEYVYLP